jgi:hypothetical protein
VPETAVARSQPIDALIRPCFNVPCSVHLNPSSASSHCSVVWQADGVLASNGAFPNHWMPVLYCVHVCMYQSPYAPTDATSRIPDSTPPTPREIVGPQMAKHNVVLGRRPGESTPRMLHCYAPARESCCVYSVARPGPLLKQLPAWAPGRGYSCPSHPLRETGAQVWVLLYPETVTAPIASLVRSQGNILA